MSDSLEIPTLDLEDLRRSDAASQERATAAIREAFGTYGLIYLKNHGVTAPDSVFERFGAFCDREPVRKQPFNRPEIWYQRGWTPPNTEKAVVASGQPDFKECWFAAPEELDPECRDEFPQIYADNVWPDDDDAFKEPYLQLGRELHAAGMLVLRGAAASLGLAESTFEEGCQGAAHVLRVLKYLPLTPAQIEAKVLWGEEHTDFNLLTLLPGGRFLDPSGKRCPPPDAGSGLYLRTRPSAAHPEGQLVRGRAPDGCIVAQVGQQLEILTGGAFLATPHVVTAPSTPGYSRYSGAHFIHLHPRQVLSPLRPFRSKATLAAYSPPVLAGTYSIKTLVDIGLAPASAISALGYRHYDRLQAIREKES